MKRMMRILTLAAFCLIALAAQSGAQTTWMALSDPGTTAPGAGAPWGLPGQPGFTALPPNVGDCIWFGKKNVHIATNTKNYTFSFTAGNATKFAVQSLTGYVNGAGGPTATPGGVTSVTDNGNQRNVTGKLIPQPDWEVIKFIRVAAAQRRTNKGDDGGGDDGDALSDVTSSSHCSKTTTAATSLTISNALFGALSEDKIRITDIQIFADTFAAGRLDSQQFKAPDSSGKWYSELVFSDPDGKERPQGGIRWSTNGPGLEAEEVYGQVFTMEDKADSHYSYYALDENSGEYQYFRIEATREVDIEERLE